MIIERTLKLRFRYAQIEGEFARVVGEARPVCCIKSKVPLLFEEDLS